MRATDFRKHASAWWCRGRPLRDLSAAQVSTRTSPTLSEAMIDVAACGNSMERERIEQDQLTEGVTVLPSAVIHLAEQQWAGAAYVRV